MVRAQHRIGWLEADTVELQNRAAQSKLICRAWPHGATADIRLFSVQRWAIAAGLDPEKLTVSTLAYIDEETGKKWPCSSIEFLRTSDKHHFKDSLVQNKLMSIGWDEEFPMDSEARDTRSRCKPAPMVARAIERLESPLQCLMECFKTTFYDTAPLFELDGRQMRVYLKDPDADTKHFLFQAQITRDPQELITEAHATTDCGMEGLLMHINMVD